MKARILVLDAGTNLDVAFTFREAKVSHYRIDKLRHFNVYAFDIIILPSHADPMKVANCRDYLNSFVASGGILICHCPRIRESQWFDSVNIIMSYHRDVSFSLSNEDAQMILNTIAHPSDVMEHDEWFSHGYFVSSTSADVVPVIVANLKDGGNGYALGIQRAFQSGGELLVSTTDFDYHSVFGPAISNVNLTKTQEDKLRLKAVRICENMSDWSVNRFCSWRMGKVLGRRLLGVFSPIYVLRFLFGALILALSGYFLLRILSGMAIGLEFVVTTVVALVALGIELYDKTILFKRG